MRRVDHTSPVGMSARLTFTPHAPGIPAIRTLVQITFWDPEKEFTWCGSPLGTYTNWACSSVRNCTLEEIDGGKSTRLESSEQLRGLLWLACTKGVQGLVQRELEQFNERLKKYIEDEL